MANMLATLGLKKKKSPDLLVRLALKALEENEEENLAKRLSQMKQVLYGSDEEEAVREKCDELCDAVISTGIMPRLIGGLQAMPFEARKDVAQIFNNLVRKYKKFAEYVGEDKDRIMITNMIGAYGNPDIALLCGQMLRECIRWDFLTQSILYHETFWLFFDQYLHLPTFDDSSDAFATLRDLLTRNKDIVKVFLEDKFDEVFSKYNMLLSSGNYVTRRQSLKLLGELLLDRINFKVMMRYISNKENLKMMMNLLRDSSPHIQFEAFHVFKVFVANPKKPPEITKILLNNREKLTAYVEKFHNDKDDEQFKAEKELLINTLAQLQLPVEADPIPAPAKTTRGEAEHRERPGGGGGAGSTARGEGGAS